MDKHTGSCRKLIQALQELMPDKFEFKFHRTGPDEECYRALILQLVKQASAESHLSTEYAIACQQVAELFEPIPGDGVKINSFIYLLTNQCQIYLTSIRNGKFVYKNHDDFMQHGEEMKTAKNVEVYKRLKQEQTIRFSSRDVTLGIIKFIAELFNVDFLKTKVMGLCMKNLLMMSEGPTELDVESFCVLLKAIGSKLENELRGTEIIEKYLTVLEQIVDSQADNFVLRIRCMILDLFELRENAWKPLRSDQVPLTVSQQNKVKIDSELIEAARKTRDFLNEVGDVLESGNLLDFMYRFKDVKCSEERLEGVVKIILKRAISLPDTSMIALMCTGLEDVTAVKADGDGDRVMRTFKEYLMQLLRGEIEVIRQKTEDFRNISARLEVLKEKGTKEELHNLKTSIEKDFEASSRAVAVSAFIGELYNADFIESRFIFDEVFIVLVDPRFISNASIESFCRLVKIAGIKMKTELNRDFLMKSSMIQLIEAAKQIKIFPKVKYIMKKATEFARFQLQLPLEDRLKEEISAYPRLQFPWKSTLLDLSNKESAKKLQNFNPIMFEPVRMPPLDFIYNFRPPKIPSANTSPFTVHGSVLERIPKRLYINSNSPNAKADGNNNGSRKVTPIPIDFTQEFVNPTMI